MIKNYATARLFKKNDVFDYTNDTQRSLFNIGLPSESNLNLCVEEKKEEEKVSSDPVTPEKTSFLQRLNNAFFKTMSFLDFSRNGWLFQGESSDKDASVQDKKK